MSALCSPSTLLGPHTVAFKVCPMEGTLIFLFCHCELRTGDAVSERASGRCCAPHLGAQVRCPEQGGGGVCSHDHMGLRGRVTASCPALDFSASLSSSFAHSAQLL